MRTALLGLVACVPIAACSADLVTAPTPVVTAPPTVVTAAAKVSIRGASSAHDSSPIFVVDGVLVFPSSSINAADIEAIEVLKGAAATMIYGSAVRCPAIVITTRRGPNASQSRPTRRPVKPAPTSATK